MVGEGGGCLGRMEALEKSGTFGRMFVDIKSGWGDGRVRVGWEGLGRVVAL